VKLRFKMTPSCSISYSKVKVVERKDKVANALKKSSYLDQRLISAKEITDKQIQIRLTFQESNRLPFNCKTGSYCPPLLYSAFMSNVGIENSFIFNATVLSCQWILMAKTSRRKYT